MKKKKKKEVVKPKIKIVQEDDRISVVFGWDYYINKEVMDLEDIALGLVKEVILGIECELLRTQFIADPHIYKRIDFGFDHITISYSTEVQEII